MSPEERDGLLRLTRRYTELLKEKINQLLSQK